MWSRPPPDPVPVGDEPAVRPRPENEAAPARPSRMLPVVQCLAEGAWLAVVAGAIQALFGEPPIIGPVEALPASLAPAAQARMPVPATSNQAPILPAGHQPSGGF